MSAEYFIIESHGKHNTMVRDFGSHGTRNISTISMIYWSMWCFNITRPFKFGVKTGDRAFSDTFGAHPIEYHNTRNYASNVENKHYHLAFPESLFGFESALRQFDYDAMCQSITLAGVEQPQLQKIGWIGSRGNILSRNLLKRISDMHSDKLEVLDVDWINHQKDFNNDSNLPGRNYMSYEQQVSRWKYLVDVEGQGYSARTKFLLFSGRPVFIADRPHEEWWMKDLVPWETHIPVKRDLSDLIDNYNLVENDKDLYDRVSKGGLKFAQNKLKLYNALERIRDVINEQ